MASFLKNTGDIILDAVLTDEGRRRLALGDGSFNITKFALGDDEIDYSLWDVSASSGNQDTKIFNTPIFEAYTNNASSLKNKLMTIDVPDLLVMPILKLCSTTNGVTNAYDYYSTYKSFLVPVYGLTEENPFSSEATAITLDSTTFITIHQGIDNIVSDKRRTMSEEGYGSLVETEYNIYVDNRLLYVAGPAQSSQEGYLTVDDDYIATWSFSMNGSDGVVSQAPRFSNTTNSPIKGSRGTQLKFKVLPKNSFKNNSGYLYTKLGSTIPAFESNNTYSVIRTTVKVVGVQTGYSIEIPILLAKKQ